MSGLGLEDRLTALAEELKQTRNLITELSKSSLQPEDPADSQATADSFVQLGDDVHRSLKDQEADFELLRQDAEDYADQTNWSSIARRGHESQDRRKIDIAARVTKLGEDLRIARVQYRQAQLSAKKNAELAKRKEREQLFAGLRADTKPGHGRSKGPEKLSKDDLVLSSSNELTASFRKLHSLLSSELERSQFARQTLEDSTKNLSNLADSYSSLDSLLSSSRSLVTTLISSQKSDTWYLESAFYLLCCTIAWLVFRRLIYGPTWWIVYLPLKLLFRCLVLLAQTSFGLLSAVAGFVGARGQQTSLAQMSEKLDAASVTMASAQGKDIPTFAAGMPKASVKAGAGGQGAKMEKSSGQLETQPAAEDHEDGVQHDESEDPKIGKEETILRDRRPDELPNPKKKVWEEPAQNQPKDEL